MCLIHLAGAVDTEQENAPQGIHTGQFVPGYMLKRKIHTT